jgi:hypothetical protein
MEGVVGVRLRPPGQRRTVLFHEVSRKTHGSGTLGRHLFVAVKPHSLSTGGGQHRGRRTGTWPRGLLLAEPPPKVASHPYDGMRLRRRRGSRKPEKGIEGGRRGRAFIKNVQMRKWYDD